MPVIDSDNCLHCLCQDKMIKMLWKNDIYSQLRHCPAFNSRVKVGAGTEHGLAGRPPPTLARGGKVVGGGYVLQHIKKSTLAGLWKFFMTRQYSISEEA